MYDQSRESGPRPGEAGRHRPPEPTPRHMATVRQEVLIDAPPERVWAALRKWGTIHRDLAPGFVTAAQLDGTDRILTFFNGPVLRELLIGLDEDRRRPAWTIVD